MDAPEPMPVFTFNPDGSTTVTHPDGTVSVNAPQPDEPAVTTTAPPDGSATAQPAGDPAGTEFLPERTDPQPEQPVTAPAAAASNSVVNPDGSVTTRLPDGSTQTVVTLPGGATIVTGTTRPGEQPAAPDSSGSRRRRGRDR